MQFGGRSAGDVQRQQFEGVAVESRHGGAAAPPGARLLPQTCGLGDRVEGLAVAGTGQGSGHPAGRGSGCPAVARSDGVRMDTVVAQVARKRNFLLFNKCLRMLPRRLQGASGRLLRSCEARTRCVRRTAAMASVGGSPRSNRLDVAQSRGRGRGRHPDRQRGWRVAARKRSAAPTASVALDGRLRAGEGLRERPEGRGVAGGTKPGGSLPLHWAMRVGRPMSFSVSGLRR